MSASGTRGQLEGKVAVVTGSSSGLGREICLLYAKEGAKVVCADLQERRPEYEIGTNASIQQSGGHAVFVQTDVTREEEVERAVQKAVEEYGRLDIMVNNAGVGQEPQKVWELSADSWHRIMGVNGHGVFYGVKHAAAQMIKQEPLPQSHGDKGWIINMSSIMGAVSEQSMSAYSASKGMVISLTKAAALDCAAERIHVNAVGPGYVGTPLTDGITVEEQRRYIEQLHPWGGGGMGKPESVAKACVFLASDAAQWITGTYLPVDGGYLAR